MSQNNSSKADQIMNIVNEIQIYYPLQKGLLLMKYTLRKERPFVVLLKKGITECQKFECEMLCWKLKLLFIINELDKNTDTKTLQPGDGGQRFFSCYLSHMMLPLF